MLTLKFNEEDVPFVLAALRMRSNALLQGVMMQIDMQHNAQKPPPPAPQEFKAEAPPVEATITAKRGRGRPKGSKTSAKRHPAKKGVAK